MAGVLFWAHVVGMVVTVAAAGGLAAWIRARYERGAATWMVRLLAILGLWGAVSTFQLLVPARGAKVALFLLGKPLGKASLLVWFVFVLVFTGRDHWLTTHVRWALGGGVALIAALTLTDPLHGLLWEGYAVNETGFPHLVATPTALELGLFSLLGVVALAGFGLLVSSLLTSRQVSRGQFAVVLAGFLVAVPAAVLQYTSLLPVPGFEYGQLNAIVFFVAVAVGIFRHDLFVVGPVARDAVIESLADGIVVLDVTGRLVDYNARAVELLPEIEGAFGERYTDALPDDVLASPEGGASGPGAENDPALAESFARETGGEEHRFSVDVTPLRSGSTTKGYGITLRDQTEVEAYAERLERRTETLDQFASTVSHDLRNPLTVGRGQLEIARETGDPEAFDRVADAFDRMDAIIEDSLTLARTGQFDLDRETVALAEVAAAAWAGTDTGVATLETDGIAEGHAVDADERRLRTLFENLFRNAVEHGPDDVTVRVETTEEGFAVADTGPGIPPGERERVFERGVTTGGNSTGLGLAIVEQIVADHGWGIRVTDADTGGARFEIET